MNSILSQIHTQTNNYTHKYSQTSAEKLSLKEQLIHICTTHTHTHTYYMYHFYTISNFSPYISISVSPSNFLPLCHFICLFFSLILSLFLSLYLFPSVFLLQYKKNLLRNSKYRTWYF